MIEINKTTFRSTFHDANPTWIVRAKAGRAAWKCEIINCPDYSGNVKLFSTREIEAAVNWAQMMAADAISCDNFFHRLPVGSVVHYANGRDAYVRCQVTESHDLMPVALVGKWLSIDLPRRQRDGSVYHGYHVQNILEKKPFHPHASHIYEYNIQQPARKQPIGFAQHASDPRNMTPLNLSVPDMTSEQRDEANKVKLIAVIRETTTRTNISSDEILETIKGIVSMYNA